jgi:transposase
MAMGTRRRRQRQEELWYRRDLAEDPGHPFYRRLNKVLDQAGFDEFCEARCRQFYHEKLGRPSLAPGMYFRVMLIGFFEGIESERGIAWRVADSLCLREFLQIGLDERTPDHVTISRTRRLMDEATHQEVFGWVLRQVARAGLLRGKTIGIDATTLEANAAMKSIVRRDTEESYTEYLKTAISLQPLFTGHSNARLDPDRLIWQQVSKISSSEHSQVVSSVGPYWL